MGNLDLVLMGRAMLSKFLIQFALDGWGCVTSLYFGLRPDYGRVISNGDLFQRGLCQHALVPRTVVFHVPDPMAGHCRPVSAGDSWTLTGKLGSVSYGVTAPFSCILMCKRFCLCPPRVCFPVLWKFCNQIPLASKVKFLGVSQSFARSPSREICCGLSSFHYNVRTSLV